MTAGSKRRAGPPAKPRGAKAPVIRSRVEAMQETRAALIDAGLALFAEQGLDGPSLDAICERAGFTRGAFYVHFADREAFLIAVMDHVGAKVLDGLLANDTSGGLAAVAARFIGAIASGTYPLAPGGAIPFHQLLVACARVESVRKHYVGLIQESMRRIGGVLGEDAAAGRLRGDLDREALATILMAVVLGAQVMLELGVAFDLAAAAQTAVQVIQTGQSHRPARR